MPDQIIHTEAYEKVLAEAERIARERGDGFVSVEHLALAIFSDPDAVPTIELRDRMGVPPGELTKRLHQFMDAPIPGPGEYGVRSLDGTVTIHPIDNPRTVLTRWDPS
jgi:hypothetical protein